MSNVQKTYAWDQAGFDAGRNLQILGLHQKTSFTLVAADGLDVRFDGDDCVTHSLGALNEKSLHKNTSLSAWEKEQILRRITVTGKAVGTAVMHATFQGSDWIAPLTIRVVSNSQNRQVGSATGEVTSALRVELQGLSLRDAVIRVAEDQLHSAVSTKSTGYGVYNIADGAEWCGAFAYWCWAQACAIKGVANPFGSDNTVLWSPQRAISFAMQNPSQVDLYRYDGYDPMGFAKDLATHKLKHQEYVEIGAGGLKRGDIVLYRSGTDRGWRHVCMVHASDPPTTGMLETIDGNQGRNTSIAIKSRDMDAKVAGGGRCLVFVHAKV